MVSCARCGEENPDRARFCLACGTPLEPGRELRKHVTVLFCDLTGSTALGERLDPEALRVTMRRYYEESRTILERHGGTVEKFIGDAVMAVFGVPQSHEDDALRAVRAASELRDAVAELGLDPRIGVNTGEVVAGEGDSLVTGDAVNVAARLEQNAEPGEVLLGAETHSLVRDAVRVEAVELEVKGKDLPVSAYRLIELDIEAPGLRRRLDSPLVGRQRELARLRDDFEHAVSQRSCHLFTLLGPAGVGKSRLVEEFVHGLDGQARVVRGRCLHYGEGITYWPLVEVLIQLGADAEAVLRLPSPPEAAVASRKLLEQEASRQPLVVLWDDIQWAEPTFLELIEHVVDWSRAAPILVLCIARPELLELRPAWGGGKANATSLLLEPLAEDEAAALIENLLGSATLDDPTRLKIIRASEGNPLFVEEMLLMLPENGDGDVVVPPTIHALLQARLDRLDSEERAVIERGAVEGEVFHRSPVAELAPAAVRDGLDGHLTRLIRNELIRPETPTIPGDDAFRFRHLLIRDAAYEALPKETRADLHERFARWVETHANLVEQDEIIGYHLEQAVLYRRELGREDGELGRAACAKLGEAGRAALARGDNRAGAALIERAGSLVPRGADDRLQWLPDLVFALMDMGRFDDGRSHLDELESSGGERWPTYARALRPMLDALSGQGSLEAGRAELAAAEKTFERLQDDRGLALALMMQGHDEWTSCHALASDAKYRRVIVHAERAGSESLVQEAVSMLFSTGSFGPAPVDAAEEEIRALLPRATGISAEASASRALGRLAATRGDFDAARELMRRGREPLADAGLPVLHAATSLGAGFIEEQAGDDETAVRIYREGFEALGGFGEHAFASTVAVSAALALVRLGREDEAEEWLAKALELSPAGDLATLISADDAAAGLHLVRGNLDEAERLARTGVERAEATDFWDLRGSLLERLAEVLAARDRADEARVHQESAIVVYDAKGATVAAARARERLLLAEL